MSKNLDNVIEILDFTKYDFDEIKQFLNEGKTIKIALELGENVKRSLTKGYSDHFDANIELIEEKENCGVCGCGKPANALFYFYK
ncbi:hypothetical protein [Spiroplasma taiwanense]|uniref:Uncharacterized protein n=1 Tax=Spiroplasma taiwanense CT-1 TaxID=1276220 RepID=S5LTU5_9MOLU|nr:hypothetical protein [Spiroplasma taiwanense]AGR41139.1 hypothetical protein STAIW_v1c05000 [Spiroplasma taiwanense CT-1]